MADSTGFCGILNIQIDKIDICKEYYFDIIHYWQQKIDLFFSVLVYTIAFYKMHL